MNFILSPPSSRRSGLKYRETSSSSPTITTNTTHRPAVQRKNNPLSSDRVVLTRRKKQYRPCRYCNPITITILFIILTSLCYITIFFVLVTTTTNSPSTNNDSFVWTRRAQKEKIRVYPRIIWSDSSNRTKLSRLVKYDTPPNHHELDESNPEDPFINRSMCIPIKSWQNISRPTCNTIHEIDFLQANLTKIGSGGWRIAWKHNFKKNDRVVLKTLKYHLSFGKQTQHRHFKDAIITSHLTSSPHIINIYAYCAQSTVNEYASTSLQKIIRDNNHAKPKFLTSKQKLLYVRDIAMGLRDLHDTASSVYKDLKPSNVVLLNNLLKLNDFNDGELLFRNVTSEDVCYFRRRRWTPNFHSPEEVREKSLSYKIDVYALGSMIYYILVGYQPYNKLKNHIVYSKVSRGILPDLPKDYEMDEDKYVQYMMELMKKCMRYEPRKRPDAKEVVVEIDDFLRKNGAL